MDEKEMKEIEADMAKADDDYQQARDAAKSDQKLYDFGKKSNDLRGDSELLLFKDQPAEFLAHVLSIREVKLKLGPSKAVDAIIQDKTGQRKVTFFLSFASIRTQFEKLKITAGDDVYISYQGIKVYEGQEFKSVYVSKY